MASEVLVKAKKIKRRKQTIKITKIVSLCLFIFLTLTFIVLSLIYKGGNFVITLDRNADLESSLIIYENKVDRNFSRQLFAEEIPFMDNISIKWLPRNIDTESDGDHNGKNYIAYTFYVENIGKENTKYWYEVVIDDVIKRVDDAIRIMIFVNGDRKVYAKKNEITKEAEPNTTPFYEGFADDEENTVVLESRDGLKPNEADRITVVVWLEGDDPDCVNAIIGGEIKMHMIIREEHTGEGESLTAKDGKKEESKEEEKKDEEEKKKEN